MDEGANDILCPACGSWFVRQLSGQDVRCPTCGKLVERWASPPPTAPDETSGDHIGFEFVSQAPRAAQRAAPLIPARRRRSHSALWVIGIVIVIVVLIAGVAAVVMSTFDASRNAQTVNSTDQSHRADLLSMKDNAERLAASGDLQQSLAEYNRLLAAVTDRDMADPMTAPLVASAQAEHNKVFARTMAEPHASAAANAAPVSTAAVAATPSWPPEVATTNAAQTVQAGPTTAPATLVATNAQPSSPTTQAIDVAQNAADNAPPLANNPRPAISLQAYTLPDSVTDEQIGEAIAKGVAYLRSRFDKNGQLMATDGEMPRLGGGGFGPGGGGGPGGGFGPGGGGGLGGGFGPGGGGPGGERRFGGGDRGEGPGEGNRGGFNRRREDNNLPGRDDLAGAYTTPGFDALAVYALLHAGQALDPKILDAHDPFAELILDQLKKYDLVYTYHRSLRAAALAVLSRQQDTAALEEDIRWLIAANRQGAYTYKMPQSPGPLSYWDNSNSQYGLLGVWSGAQAGMGVPASYWSAIDAHWSGCAISGGTWGYHADSPSTLSMTLAGVASELVSRDYLNAPNGPADAGLAWLDSGDNCTEGVRTSWFPTYTLYGLERVGLASGYKYFGKHDWYSEFARQLVNQQHGNGSWGTGGNESLVDTSYSLLFLARGRHPILFNKLRYDGNWNAHPRDVMHLARYASRQLERPLNWQVVNLRPDWYDWLDSPVLYISGTAAPTLSDTDFDALRSFVEAGGLIFTQADNGSPAFNKWVAFAAHKMFPRYELMSVPANHPLYSVNYQFKKPPPLMSISNGSRLLLVHSPTDIARGWQLDWSDTYANDFHLGLNLFVYAAGKSVNLKHRLASSYIPPAPEAATTTQTMVCLRYAGAWNPEPYAMTRFARYFQWETRIGLNVPVVDLKSLQPGSAPMAVLTGTVRNDFTGAEVSAARNFVSAGGVLVIDACGGQTAFANSVEKTLIARAFPQATLAPLPDDYPGLIASRSGADDLRKPIYRPYAIEQLGRVPLLGFTFGRGRVLYSRLDLTTGLLGTQSWGILGFDPAYAQALMKNLVLWSNARAANQQLSTRAN